MVDPSLLLAPAASVSGGSRLGHVLAVGMVSLVVLIVGTRARGIWHSLVMGRSWKDPGPAWRDGLATLAVTMPLLTWLGPVKRPTVALVSSFVLCCTFILAKQRCARLGCCRSSTLASPSLPGMESLATLIALGVAILASAGGLSPHLTAVTLVSSHMLVRLTSRLLRGQSLVVPAGEWLLLLAYVLPTTF